MSTSWPLHDRLPGPAHLLSVAEFRSAEGPKTPGLSVSGCGLTASRRTRSGRVSVHATEVSTGQRQSFGADRVLIGAGAIGTTRIVAGSLGLTDRSIMLAEAIQFMTPFLSREAGSRAHAGWRVHSQPVQSLRHLRQRRQGSRACALLPVQRRYVGLAPGLCNLWTAERIDKNGSSAPDGSALATRLHGPRLLSSYASAERRLTILCHQSR